MSFGFSPAIIFPNRRSICATNWIYRAGRVFCSFCRVWLYNLILHPKPWWTNTLTQGRKRRLLWMWWSFLWGNTNLAFMEGGSSVSFWLLQKSEVFIHVNIFSRKFTFYGFVVCFYFGRLIWERSYRFNPEHGLQPGVSPLSVWGSSRFPPTF